MEFGVDLILRESAGRFGNPAIVSNRIVPDQHGLRRAIVVNGEMEIGDDELGGIELEVRRNFQHLGAPSETPPSVGSNEPFGRSVVEIHVQGGIRRLENDAVGIDQRNGMAEDGLPVKRDNDLQRVPELAAIRVRFAENPEETQWIEFSGRQLHGDFVIPVVVENIPPLFHLVATACRKISVSDVNGKTIRLDGDGEKARVRFHGINIPEVSGFSTEFPARGTARMIQQDHTMPPSVLANAL